MAQREQHIYVLEMKTVLLALQAFAVHIKGHSVLLATDNTMVAAYINRQGGSLLDIVQPSCRSRSVVCKEQGPYESQVPVRKTQRLSRPIVEERGNSSKRVVSQSGRWSSGCKVLIQIRPDMQLKKRRRTNGLASLLIADLPECNMCELILVCHKIDSKIFHIWDKPHIDLFATHLNLKLPTFVSPVLEPEENATEAMSLSWQGMWAYAFPPFPLIPPCIRTIQEEGCLVCLIAPLWVVQTRFPLLLKLLVANAICLQWRKD